MVVDSEGTLSTEEGVFSSGGEIYAKLTGNGGLKTIEDTTTLISTGSNYSGATVVEDGASLIALNDSALSTESEHTIQIFGVGSTSGESAG